MTTTQMLDKLKGYFNSDPYSDELSKQLFEFIGMIPEPDHQRVYERAVQDRKYRTPIMVSDLKQACEFLGVPYSRTTQIEKFEITCEACETPYTYAMYVTDADEASGVFCRCPNCGLPGSDQLLAHRYFPLIHKMPEWFIAEKEHFLQQLQPGGHFQGGRYHKGEGEIHVTGDEWLKSHKGE